MPKNSAKQSRQHARIQRRLSSNERTHMRGERTHNVTQRADTHIFTGGGRTHNITKRTDTQIFFEKTKLTNQTDKAIYWVSMLPKKMLVKRNVVHKILWFKQKSWSKKEYESKKKFYVKKKLFLGKHFLVKKNIARKNGSENIFGPKFLLGPIKFWFYYNSALEGPKKFVVRKLWL